MTKQRLQAWGDDKILHIATCVVYNTSGQLLLLQRHSDDLGGGKWGQPGGRIEPGEDPDICVVRELREETALAPAEVRRLGAHLVTMPHGAVHMTTYLARVADDAPITLDPEEHHAYAWFDPVRLLDEDNLLWGIPTILRDFGLLADFVTDPTLSDGSQVALVARAEDD